MEVFSLNLEKYSNHLIHDAELNFEKKTVNFTTINKADIYKNLNGNNLKSAQFEDVGIILYILKSNDSIIFSLDPENNNINSEFHLKRYEPSSLKGTKIGEDLFNADYLMKQMALGTRVITLNPLRIVEFILPEELRLAGLSNIYNNTSGQDQLKENSGRIWFNMDNYEKILKNSTDSNIRIKELKVNVSYQKSVVANDGALNYVDELDESNPILLFSKKLTETFETSCNFYPEYKRLKEIYNAFIIAKFINYNKLKYDEEWSKIMYNQNLIYGFQNKNLEDTLKSGVRKTTKGLQLNGTRLSNCSIDYTRFMINLTDSVPKIEAKKGFIIGKKSTLLLNGNRSVYSLSYKPFNLSGGISLKLLNGKNNNNNFTAKICYSNRTKLNDNDNFNYTPCDSITKYKNHLYQDFGEHSDIALNPYLFKNKMKDIGCYITAFTNALNRINYNLPGTNKTITVKEFHDFADKNSKLSYWRNKGLLRDINEYLGINFEVIEVEEAKSNNFHEEINSIISQGKAIILRISSPNSSIFWTSYHFVNVDGSCIRDGKAIIKFSETKKEFVINNKKEEISIDDLYKDKKAEFRIISKK